jgi:hypothetical protein
MSASIVGYERALNNPQDEKTSACSKAGVLCFIRTEWVDLTQRRSDATHLPPMTHYHYDRNDNYRGRTTDEPPSPLPSVVGLAVVGLLALTLLPWVMLGGAGYAGYKVWDHFSK